MTSATDGRISSHSLKSVQTSTSTYSQKTTGQNSSQEKEHAHQTTSAIASHKPVSTTSNAPSAKPDGDFIGNRT